MVVSVLASMAMPVSRNQRNTVLTDALGWMLLRMAHAPTTCGVAIEVPDMLINMSLVLASEEII